ncbi:hypothetical protein DEU56DRAFT_762038 [Suillus clintonianus]|uniref:uncharacterized protein n=1 Tax=Suillus clintonianus TaxID=1904413 RepID=UPI001B87401F|nr:uncharacterized protein DEU56DRAFT_762038 [Suillus clintonianus]KAG2112429.1 hypothetical protein DEU56DRAFT_762038 [Suillus clintonianus]
MSNIGGRPVASFIANNFERLGKVSNNSNHYFWKCKHCGDSDDSPGGHIQGCDNLLPNHIANKCTKVNSALRQQACSFIIKKTGNTATSDTILADLGTTQSAKRCNLSVETFETLGKIRANLRYLRDKKATEANKSTRCRHAHMHTREETGIDLKVARDLEENFAWVPPLAAKPAHLDDSLAGPESILPDDVAAEFAAFEGRAREETFESVDGKEVLEGRAFDFKELLRVDQGIIP